MTGVYYYSSIAGETTLSGCLSRLSMTDRRKIDTINAEADNDTPQTQPAQRLDQAADKNKSQPDGYQFLSPGVTQQRKIPSTSGAASRLFLQAARETAERRETAESRASEVLSDPSMAKTLSKIEEENAVQNLRLDMREELLKRLLKSNLGGPGAPKQSPQVQAAFAKRLEELLFKTSKSVHAYADTATLDKRLQALMTAMQKRKARKPGDSAASGGGGTAKGAIRRRSSASKSPTGQRKREVLLRLLGQTKMTRVFNVVAEIKLIQLGREVTEGQPYRSVSNCTASGCKFSVPCQGDKKAPKVVRDLFFNTAIVAALEKSKPEQVETLPWDQLLAQGEARLAAYHMWFRERQASARPPS